LLFSWPSLPGTCWTPFSLHRALWPGSGADRGRCAHLTGYRAPASFHRLVARSHNTMASKSYQKLAWGLRAFDRRPQHAGHVLGAVLPASRPVRGGGPGPSGGRCAQLTGAPPLRSSTGLLTAITPWPPGPSKKLAVAFAFALTACLSPISAGCHDGANEFPCENGPGRCFWCALNITSWDFLHLLYNSRGRIAEERKLFPPCSVNTNAETQTEADA
jgi:hypothetical protein